MKISLAKRLFFGFLGVILVTCTLCGGIGLGLLDRSIVSRIQDKVRFDLRSAQDLFEEELANIREPMRISALTFPDHATDSLADIAALQTQLTRFADKESLDILTFMSPTADLILRIRNPGLTEPTSLGIELLNRIKTERKGIASTEVLDRDELMKEGLNLDKQARVELVASPYLRSDDKEMATAWSSLPPFPFWTIMMCSSECSMAEG
jgi:hypothetical protein